MGVDIQFYNQTSESVETYEAMITTVVNETIKQENLTNEMLEQFEEEKNNTIISTIILELGMTVSLFSVIPLQKKLITEENEF